MNNELQQILSTMDVPRQRLSDLRWLWRNLAINNGQHEHIDRALLLIRQDLDNDNAK
jgi:hypothetical protein